MKSGSLIYKKPNLITVNIALRSVLLLFWGLTLTSLVITLMLTDVIPWYVPFRIGVFLSVLTIVLLTDPLNYYNPVISFFVYYLIVCVIGADPILSPFAIVPATYQLYLLSLFCYLGGVLFMIFMMNGKRTPGLQQPVISNANQKTIQIGLLVFGVGAILTLFLFRFVFGVIPLFAEDAENAHITLRAGLGFMVSPAMISLQVGSLIYFACQVVRGGIVRFVKGTLVVLVAAALIMGYGTRGPAVTVILLAFILFNYIRYGKLAVGQALIFGLGLALVFGTVGILRWGLGNMAYSFDKIAEVSLWRIVTVTPYVLNLLVQTFPYSVPFQHGATFWADFIAFLPGPGEGSGILLKNLLGLQFSGGGVAPTIAGELYVNFGWLGTGIGLFLTGMFLQWLGFAIAVHKKSRSPLDMVMMTILTCMLALTPGGQIGAHIMMNIFPALIVWFALKLVLR